MDHSNDTTTEEGELIVCPEVEVFLLNFAMSM